MLDQVLLSSVLPLAAMQTPKAESTAPKPAQSILETLRDPKTAATIGLASYVLGFLVESIYYSSLGAAPLELGRTKYILSGLLFLIFLGGVLNPFYLSYRLMIERGLTARDAAKLFPFLWLLTSITWRVIVSGLSSLIGPASAQAGSFPAFSMEDLSEFGSMLGQAALVLPAFALILWIVFLLADVVRSKQTPAPQDKWRNRWLLTLAMGRSVALTLFIGQTLLFIARMAGKTTSAFFPGTRSTAMFVSDEWRLFWLAPIILSFTVYLLAVSSMWLLWSTGRDLDNRPGPVGSGLILDVVTGWGRQVVVGNIAYWTLALLFFPYSMFVFPRLPQHLGGGAPVLATISLRQPSVSIDGGVQISARLLVRGANVLFFTDTDPTTVIELPASSIESIRYSKTQADAGFASDADRSIEGADGGLAEESSDSGR